ncbi:MAG: hypothetical protein F6K11_13750 [Leptolyngbya sp. SIO3F4]|nr:hypothetical protein [Leptolyngbya sp. SIO3F4]
MVLFSAVELINPQLFDNLNQAETTTTVKRLHAIGIWYVWLIFTVAFSLGSLAKHLMFYNLPAFILFIAAAIIHGTSRWRGSYQT